MSCTTAVLLAEREAFDAGMDLSSLVISAASLCHARSMGVPLDQMPLLVGRVQRLVAMVEHPNDRYRQAWEQANPCNALGMAVSALAGDSEYMGDAARCLRNLAVRLQKVGL